MTNQFVNHELLFNRTSDKGDQSEVTSNSMKLEPRAFRNARAGSVPCATQNRRKV